MLEIIVKKEIKKHKFDFFERQDRQNDQKSVE